MIVCKSRHITTAVGVSENLHLERSFLKETVCNGTKGKNCCSLLRNISQEHPMYRKQGLSDGWNKKQVSSLKPVQRDRKIPIQKSRNLQERQVEECEGKDMHYICTAGREVKLIRHQLVWRNNKRGSKNVTHHIKN